MQEVETPVQQPSCSQGSAQTVPNNQLSQAVLTKRTDPIAAFAAARAADAQRVRDERAANLRKQAAQRESRVSARPSFLPDHWVLGMDMPWSAAAGGGAAL